MHVSAVPVVIAYTVAGVFALAGSLHLTGPKFLRDAYARVDLPVGLRRFVGVLALLTGCFLALAETRVWGVVLAAPIVFITVVMLLNRRQYLLALPVMLILAALPPTLLAASV
jgi:hypothetical protein